MSDSIGTTRKHREYDALLERYQQLELISKFMFHVISTASLRKLQIGRLTVEEVRINLEALGVEV